jgi:hypothetical protein
VLSNVKATFRWSSRCAPGCPRAAAVVPERSDGFPGQEQVRWSVASAVLAVAHPERARRGSAGMSLLGRSQRGLRIGRWSRAFPDRWGRRRSPAAEGSPPAGRNRYVGIDNGGTAAERGIVLRPFIALRRKVVRRI